MLNSSNLKKYVLIPSLLAFSLLASLNISKAADMQVEVFSTDVLVREDYTLYCKETFTFQYETFTPNEIVFTWPYKKENLAFSYVKKKLATEGSLGDDADYILESTPINHSSGRDEGTNMTITGLTLTQTTSYTISMEFLIFNQVKNTDKQNFYDKILGRDKTNLEVTFWSHTWPEDAVNTDTSKREMALGTQKQMRPKICEYADGGDVEWSVRAEYFATAGHAAFFGPESMPESYLDDHNSFGVTVYYGKTEKTWLFYGYATLIVLGLLFVTYKVVSRAKKKTERTGFYEEEEVDV